MVVKICLEESKKRLKSIFNKKIRKIFNGKKNLLKLNNTDLDLVFIWNRPIIGENIYAQAFPNENRIKMEVFAPELTENDIIENVCHELIHIKNPNIDHHEKKFEEKVQRIKKDRGYTN